MHRVSGFLLTLIFLSPIIASAQQQQAVVKEFSGKVEVKLPGQDWQPVQLNMSVSQGATVSTGFGSRLVLELGQTEIAVRPLTRMLLRELIKNGSTNLTSLTLRVGKVNVAVKSASGEKNDFTIRGPASTAAVRGTEFSYDVNIDDQAEGLGGYFFLINNTTGQAIGVGPGMFGAIDNDGHLTLSDQILAHHSSSGWIPSDLLYWASLHENGWTLPAFTSNLTAPNVLPTVVGTRVVGTPPVPTLTVTVN
jgi:hypothetical protein